MRMALAAMVVLVGAASSNRILPDAPPLLFESPTVVPIQLQARFNELFAHAAAGDAYAVDGMLSYIGPNGTVNLSDIQISVRGHSSIDAAECTFPKLQVTFHGGASLEASPFRGMSAVRIGTHCAERTDSDLTPLGRLANEKAPLREAAVYRLLAAMNVPTLKARAARITYTYLDPQTDQLPDQTRPFARNALFVEDDRAAMQRLGANPLKGFSDGGSDFASADVLRASFGQAMIGNFDWCLRLNGEDSHHCDAKQLLYNVLAFQRPDGRGIPVIYDFDLSGMVTERHVWFDDTYNRRFAGARSTIEVEVLSQVQRARSLFPREALDAVRSEFKRRKRQAYRALSEAVVDRHGRAIIRAHLDEFFAAIEDDRSFYRPAVVRNDTYAYVDPGATEVLCSSRGPVPRGTPVSAPQERSGNMVRVDVLDTQWYWAWQCAPIRTGPVWIDSRAIDVNYPRPTMQVEHNPW